jgi:hypothetical protein
MNKSLYAIAAVTVLCMSAAQAAPQAAAAPAADPSVQIASTRTHFHLVPSDFDSYAGTYALSNGDVMKLKRMGRHYYTQLYGQDPVEIVALGTGVFGAKDGTTLTFRDNNDTLVIDGPNQHQVASR